MRLHLLLFFISFYFHSALAGPQCHSFLKPLPEGFTFSTEISSSNEWQVKAIDPEAKVVGILEASLIEPGKVSIDIVYVNEKLRGKGISTELYRNLFNMLDSKTILSSSLSTENEKAFINHYLKISNPENPEYRPNLSEPQRYLEALKHTPESKIKRAFGYTKVVSLVVKGLSPTKIQDSVLIDVEVAKE